MASVITGTGRYVPQRCVTNEELAAQIGGDAAWIEQRTGIRQRHFAADDESASALGTHAARAALDDAGLEPQALDAIIFATLSADMAFPGCGVFVQRELGVAPIPALDVRNQCSGYLYALSVAHAWIIAGMYERILVIGSEVHSAGLDFSEAGRTITALFGDGAAAAIVERRDDAPDQPRGVLDIKLGADGAGAEHLWSKYPGSNWRPHVSADRLAEGLHYPTMNGRSVYRHAVTTLVREVGELFDRHGLHGRDDVLLVPHQANQLINEHVARELHIPESQVVHTIDRFGNTTAASIPMALDVARREGRLTPGTLVVHAAFGSGFTWGTALVGF